MTDTEAQALAIAIFDADQSITIKDIDTLRRMFRGWDGQEDLTAVCDRTEGLSWAAVKRAPRQAYRLMAQKEQVHDAND
jgi:hypothetical protein